MLSYTNKSVIVTGGASGIGKSIALAFSKQGATIHVVDIHLEPANKVVQEIIELGGKAIGYQCDVSNTLQVNQVLGSIRPVDIIVNNAGISHIGTVETTTEADIDKMYQVNIKSVYNCCHAILPIMKEKKTGIILNICSVAAHVGLTDRFAYSMTKGAVYAMTLSIAKDYLAHHIRCNCISPGRIHTPFVDNYLSKNYPGKEKEMFDKLSKTQPIGRMGTPEEVANLALYICSDEASFITGTDYALDGGFKTLNT